MFGQRRRRPLGDDGAAALAALGAQVEQPVGGGDQVQVVLDHQQRVAGVEQLLEGPEQLRDVLEVQAGGRFVEQEQGRPGVRAALLAPRRLGRLGQVAGQLQALGLAAGQGRHRLAEAQVVQPDIGDRRQRGQHRRLVGEEGHRLRDGHFEHLGHRPIAPSQLEDLGPVALAVAVRAAQVDVGQELHLDVLEARAGAGRAAAVAGVEAEGAGRVAALLRFGQHREQLADRVPGADVADRVGARALADRRLVHEHHVAQPIDPVEPLEGAGRFARLAEVLGQRRVQHVLQQRGLARAGDAGDAHQVAERDADVDAAQVVLARAGQQQRRPARRHRARAAVAIHALAPGQVVAGQRVRVGRHLGRRREGHDAPAALARPGTDVEQPVGGEHHLRVVLDHHQ